MENLYSILCFVFGSFIAWMVFCFIREVFYKSTTEPNCGNDSAEHHLWLTASLGDFKEVQKCPRCKGEREQKTDKKNLKRGGWVYTK